MMGALFAFAILVLMLLSWLCGVTDGIVTAGLENVIEIISGFSFGVRLVVGRMASPAKMGVFLDVTLEKWYLSLLSVFVAGLPIAFWGFDPIRKGGAPSLRDKHDLPPFAKVDHKVVGGVALLGLGCGLVRVCPGPAAVNFGAIMQSMGMCVFLTGVTGAM